MASTALSATVRRTPEDGGFGVLGDASLHLRPLSATSQRLWEIGGGDGAPPALGSDLRLAVRADDHATFRSLDSILVQLTPHAGPDELAALTRVADYLAEVRPSVDTDGWGRVLRDSVTFAVMRRVSRESYYTARVIDLSARSVNAILSRLPYDRVHVDHADRLDRPTLKVLARAMLLLEPRHGFTWVWHLDSDPTSTNGEAADLFALSRVALLQQLLVMLRPMVVHRGAAPASPGTPEENGAGLEEMASELVMQNYDRCFLLRPSLLRGSDPAATSEVMRLTGLAAVNVGRHETALEALRQAEHEMDAGRRSHLAYLQGLIHGKRCYELSTSTQEYQRGLHLLEAGGDANADLALERGWLLNGLALNEAILWRRAPAARERHARAFALEQEAFDLVRNGASPSRMYLRFNLLANSALLMEMVGEFDVALDTLRRTFDFDVDRSEANQSRWESTMGYRIGVLHSRAGRLDAAYRTLHHAAGRDDAVENWPVRERILRALGAVAHARGSTAEAEAIFREGLDGCREARMAEGAREHARGLITALLAAGERDRAHAVFDELSAVEGLRVAERLDEVRFRPPSPKLPAYFPEIDLEGIPAIDLNRFLGTGAAGADSERGLWSG